MELELILDQFQQFVLSGQSDIASSIISTEKVKADKRLNIYRDAYKLRLIECLTTNFPGVHLYLGTQEFEKLCAAYIAAHPSTYKSIRWYGDALAHFIKHHYTQDAAYLAELTDFEWKVGLAFDAADEEVIQVEAMAQVPPEDWAGLQFIPHPSLHRMNYFWNVVPVWQALTHEQTLPEIEQKQQAKAWVLWRAPDYQVKFKHLSDQEAWAIDVMIQGLSFGELCEGLCNWFDAEEVGMHAATYLKSWITNGLLVRMQ